MYIYIYIHIYSIRLVVVTSLKCSIGRAKYINITTIGWIKQQNSSSTLLYLLIRRKNKQFLRFDMMSIYMSIYIYIYVKPFPEQVIVAEQDCMLQFVEKLKL